MLLATFSFSIMGLCVKLNSTSFNEYELVFYRSFVSLIILVVLMKKNLGVSATIAQLAITRAYREGKTLNNAAYSYMTVIFSVGWGVWIFQEDLDWLTLMGILLIFLAGIFINKTKLRLK
jgi:hypothetical protein